ncbi:MAG: FadR family transcriptional regulator, partial [Spirochaetales bacterium]|nr:FadR family transcriptional regulator [Spirochaetales bacterium]
MLEQINNQEQSLSQKTVEKLVEHIKTSGLKPGDRIPNETELCKALSVSRSTLREAIKILVSRNILVINRGVGTFISSTPGVTDDPLGL